MVVQGRYSIRTPFLFVSSMTVAGMMGRNTILNLGPVHKDNFYNRAIISGSGFVELRTWLVQRNTRSVHCIPETQWKSCVSIVAQVAHSSVVVRRRATIGVGFECLNTKYFMIMHGMPGRKWAWGLRHPLQLLIRISVSWKHFFFLQEVLCKCKPGRYVRAGGGGIRFERKSRGKWIHITWTVSRKSLRNLKHRTSLKN
jgi:hypothetical protein